METQKLAFTPDKDPFFLRRRSEDRHFFLGCEKGEAPHRGVYYVFDTRANPPSLHVNLNNPVPDIARNVKGSPEGELAFKREATRGLLDSIFRSAEGDILFTEFKMGALDSLLHRKDLISVHVLQLVLHDEYTIQSAHSEKDLLSDRDLYIRRPAQITYNRVINSIDHGVCDERLKTISLEMAEAILCHAFPSELSIDDALDRLAMVERVASQAKYDGIQVSYNVSMNGHDFHHAAIGLSRDFLEKNAPKYDSGNVPGVYATVPAIT